MLEKKIWPNFLYAILLLIICITLWQMATSPAHLSHVAMYTLYNTTLPYHYPIDQLPIDDYHQLINIANFTFPLLNLPCISNDSTLLLILIHSNMHNYRRRLTIRETWGKVSDRHQVKVLFVVGQGDNQSKLDRENEIHNDIVQGSFQDAYRNMTYKHVTVFKYAIYHCPLAKYILKTDDDVFVNVPLLISFLKNHLSPFGGSRMLFCSVRKRSMVLRSWRSKWRVSFKEYSNKTYPPYCPGWALLYSPDVVFQLYREAQMSDYFWIDDVHITGTLVERIGLRHTDLDKLILTGGDLYNLLYRNDGRNNQSFLFGPPNINSHEIRALWGYVTSHQMALSIQQDTL